MTVHDLVGILHDVSPDPSTTAATGGSADGTSVWMLAAILAAVAAVAVLVWRLRSQP